MFNLVKWYMKNNHFQTYKIFKNVLENVLNRFNLVHFIKLYYKI